MWIFLFIQRSSRWDGVADRTLAQSLPATNGWCELADVPSFSVSQLETRGEGWALSQPCFSL